MLTVERLASTFARGLERADARSPQAKSMRSDRVYSPGIGPHSERQTIDLVMAELKPDDGSFSRYQVQVPYPNNPRRRCDLRIECQPVPWNIEIKMARFKGDNGKPSDEALMHLISPYESDRSALTDCQKLAASGFTGSLAILIYGFDTDDKPLDPAIEAFEALARLRVDISNRAVASFSGLIHPVLARGRVFTWEIRPVGLPQSLTSQEQLFVW